MNNYLVKRHGRHVLDNDEGWVIERTMHEGDETYVDTVAILDTETLANLFLDALLTGLEASDYPAGQPIPCP